MNPIHLCGQGRLGSRVRDLLEAEGVEVVPVRLDSNRGLPAGDIDTLMVCVAPGPAVPAGQRPAWWRGLFDGLSRQVQDGERRLRRLLFVSSTRVFDGAPPGRVDGGGAAIPESEAALALATAERAALALAAQACCVRLAGIYGGEYAVYDPRAFSMDRPRHGVDVDAAARALVRLVAETRWPAFHLLSDGQVYWRGRAYPWDSAEAEALARDWPVFCPSRI